MEVHKFVDDDGGGGSTSADVMSIATYIYIYIFFSTISKPDPETAETFDNNFYPHIKGTYFKLYK